MSKKQANASSGSLKTGVPTTFKEAAIEAAKEFLRVLLASAVIVVPMLIVQLETAGTVDWKSISIAAIVAALKAIDKLFHKWDGTNLTGLMPF